FQQRFKVHMSYPADDVAVPDSTQVFDISSTIEALKFLRMSTSPTLFEVDKQQKVSLYKSTQWTS
ncbi:1424_t:CDS:2, partial [Entrophospora sp. SA101]